MNYILEIIFIALLVLTPLVIIDKVTNQFKLTTLFINTWVVLFQVIKSMGSWKGILSLSIVWLSLSGAGLAIIGLIIRSAWLTGISGAIFLFWSGPGTPLISITVAIALLVQRYIFRDTSVSLANIKRAFKELKKDKSNLEQEENKK